MAFNVVVANNISITLQYAYALFNPSTKNSFISTKFTQKFDMLLEPFEYELHVNTPTSNFLVIDRVFNCNMPMLCLIPVLRIHLFLLKTKADDLPKIAFKTK